MRLKSHEELGSNKYKSLGARIEDVPKMLKKYSFSRKISLKSFFSKSQLDKLFLYFENIKICFEIF